MEDNTPKQEPKVRWTRLLKPIFKTKANRTKTRWTILLKQNSFYPYSTNPRWVIAPIGGFYYQNRTLNFLFVKYE